MRQLKNNKYKRMKRTFLALVTAAVMLACNSADDKKAGEATAGNTADPSQNPAYDKGLDVLVKYDCATCHKVEDKIKGPSYREVANKYAGQADAVKYLSEKIIKGGSGVWGTEPMAAHPTMTQADAEAIVNYILLLKK
jgi:cytochrome c